MMVSRVLKVMVAALFVMAIGTGAAEAATPWPNNSSYACVWHKGTASGTSLVSFALGGTEFYQQGLMTTVYPTAPTAYVGVRLWLHIVTAENKFDLVTDNGVSCVLTALDNGRILQFRGCSNGAIQDCFQ